MRPVRFLVIATLAFEMAGCGGSNTTTTSAIVIPDAVLAGIWVGTDSASGLTLTGVVNSGGVADFIRSDGTQYVGTVQTAGDTLVMALSIYTQFGSEFSDGSTYGLGTLNASAVSDTAIDGTLSFTTTNNSTVSSNWSLSFSNLSNATSSLKGVSGNYADASTTDPLTGATVSINGSGAITAQSAATGCVLNGTIATADISENVYEVSYTLGSCAGADAVLNGIEFTGLALLNSAASPAQLIIGVKGQNNGGPYYGLVSTLNLG
jgi:hypothetical protein